jgi:hypothetical protein
MSAQHPTPDDLRTIADNLQAEGHISRAEVIRNAADALAAKDKAIEAARKTIQALGESHHINMQERGNKFHPGEFKNCPASTCRSSRAEAAALERK